ncbi:MAG: pyruvate dehydrogenase complex dihydrolipoamide acetyltransferase [Proteobacteria bacterium]|nr:pyruvate dehydrogenase complex dihydrolipoamide acetyltransferase [Pseudomonadota bacterium]
MSTEILMPAVSPSMTEGGIARWLKREGDAVKAGEPMVEIETDKAVVEYEAQRDGILEKILVPDGSANVKVDQVIAMLLTSGENATTIPEKSNVASPPLAVVAAPSAAAAPVAAVDAALRASSSVSSGRVPASPLARRLAAANNVDLALLKGSGPNGRVVKLDVESASARRPTLSAVTPASGATYESIPNNGMRRLIAQRLSEAKQTIPHFYLSIDCDIDALLDMRKELNDWADNVKLSVNDFIIKAVALAMKQTPGVNASWSEAATLRYQTVDVSVAVSSPSGLITPIIRDADLKSLSQISGEMKELAERGRQGKLQAQEYQGGGFTISNLGMYGIREFAAIINPPQSCILAVGAGEQRPVVKHGALAITSVMTCTLSADHRVVDGALGAEFLAAFRKLVEHPLTMLL